MIPKLTDEAVSLLPLESGRAELLEEIMTTVAPDRQNAEPTPLSGGPRRARWLVPLAVAAAVATVASSPLWWGALHDDEPSVSVATQLDLPHGQGIVLDAPGWRVDSLSGDGLRFRNGDADLEVNSYAADSYESYVVDREHIVDPAAPGKPIQVLGKAAQMWAYSADDHTAIREVEDGHWLEFRGGGMDEAAYLALLGQLRLTSEAEFNASLPDDYVTEGERTEAARQIIDDIQAVSGAGFPTGTSLQLGEGDSKDHYQFGAEVVANYTCAWLEYFENAKSHDQQGRADEAARVLGTSRQWPILKQMDADGDYPEVVWEYSDTVADGQVPKGYREGLGCS